MIYNFITKAPQARDFDTTTCKKGLFCSIFNQLTPYNTFFVSARKANFAQSFLNII